jgi:hypothetical protein
MSASLSGKAEREMADNFVIEKFFARVLLRTLLGILLVAAVIYPADWLVWRARMARGGGMDAVQVDLYTVAELKGSKEDYYPNGTEMMPCSKTLYPQGGNSPCWWLVRHREVIQRY